MRSSSRGRFVRQDGCQLYVSQKVLRCVSSPPYPCRKCQHLHWNWIPYPQAAPRQYPHQNSHGSEYFPANPLPYPVIPPFVQYSPPEFPLFLQLPLQALENPPASRLSAEMQVYGPQSHLGLHPREPTGETTRSKRHHGPSPAWTITCRSSSLS